MNSPEKQTPLTERELEAAFSTSMQLLITEKGKAYAFALRDAISGTLMLEQALQRPVTTLEELLTILKGQRENRRDYLRASELVVNALTIIHKLNGNLSIAELIKQVQWQQRQRE